MALTGKPGGIKSRLLEAGRKASRFTRLVLSWLLLGAVYVLVFFPARVVTAVAGVDLLRTKIRRKAPSYWQKTVHPGRHTDYRSWFS
jgi:hypothetical protein